jgi:hypothetical protein
MGTIPDRTLAMALASLVVNSGDVSCHFDTDSDVQEEIDRVTAAKGGSPARVISLGGGVTDPVHKFWKLREAGAITKDCHVIFIGVNDCPDWNDLVRIYGGLRFGSLFIMKVSPNTKPGICPSQRGMYFN